MPGFDKTGPAGSGPMTGRGQGWCGSARPDQQTGGGFAGYENQYGFGRRGNRGGGMGRGGRRMGFFAAQQPPLGAMEPAEEVESLKIQVEKLQQTLDALLQKTTTTEKDE